MTYLEVSADDDQVNTRPSFFDACFFDRSIDGVQHSMALDKF